MKFNNNKGLTGTYSLFQPVPLCTTYLIDIIKDVLLLHQLHHLRPRPIYHHLSEIMTHNIQSRECPIPHATDRFTSHNPHFRQKSPDLYALDLSFFNENSFRVDGNTITEQIRQDLDKVRLS